VRSEGQAPRVLRLVWDENYPDFWGIVVDGQFWPAADDKIAWVYSLLRELCPDDSIMVGPESNDTLHQMLAANSRPFPEQPFPIGG